LSETQTNKGGKLDSGRRVRKVRINHLINLLLVPIDSFVLSPEIVIGDAMALLIFLENVTESTVRRQISKTLTQKKQRRLTE
jgi:hypothetical protein